MNRADTVICAEYLLTMNSGLDVIQNGAVAVQGSTIAAVGPADAIMNEFSSDKVIDCRGKVLMPGFVNTHTHASMVFFRGLADDMPLKEWLENHIWPAEAKWLSPEFVCDAAELACMEMIMAGVTLFNDMYFYVDSVAMAAKKMGMRAVIGNGILDFPTKTGKSPEDYLKTAEEFAKKYKNDDLISSCLAPHSSYTCSSETLKKVCKTAEKLDLFVCTHLSETEWEISEIVSRYGSRPVQHLDNAGLLNERLIAAHCVWLDEAEIDLMSKRGVNVSHCIESNLKLASGIAPVPAMLKAGVKVSLGTDGAASNNDLSIMGEMATAAKVHKAVAKDPTVLDAKTALLMATRWGAEALGLGSVAGSIEPGKRADIITISLNKPHFMPVYDICSHIVYAAQASDVQDVMINGELLLRNRELVHASEEDILAKAQEWGSRITG
ncbi:MAG: amidohydrolase family protein [Dissulfurispiraceae bacterium]|jgi:5-methylthioadenosine/S-adenosylhomocysteine deaminase|nr:amidohydrolase family protein [Dissulfurispiraceae bacterium]